MAEELKLDEKQTVEFQKINEEFQQKMEAQRKEMLAMQNERKADLKKILTEEQYQKLQEMQQPRKGPRGGNMRKEKN